MENATRCTMLVLFTASIYFHFHLAHHIYTQRKEKTTLYVTFKTPRIYSSLRASISLRVQPLGSSIIGEESLFTMEDINASMTLFPDVPSTRTLGTGDTPATFPRPELDSPFLPVAATVPLSVVGSEFLANGATPLTDAHTTSTGSELDFLNEESNYISSSFPSLLSSIKAFIKTVDGIAEVGACSLYLRALV